MNVLLDTEMEIISNTSTHLPLNGNGKGPRGPSYKTDGNV